MVWNTIFWYVDCDCGPSGLGEKMQYHAIYIFGKKLSVWYTLTLTEQTRIYVGWTNFQHARTESALSCTFISIEKTTLTTFTDSYIAMLKETCCLQCICN